MTKVKICGLKREEDIYFANMLKPDYVGFVFAESRRRVDKDRARELSGKLDKKIKKVGVFLNESADEVKRIAEYCGLDVLQFHGEESPGYCRLFRQEVWKAFRIKNKESLKELEEYEVDGYLLDTFVWGQYGGTGKSFNWDIAVGLSRSRFVILSGGLTPENVKKALETVRPQVADVSSGVETAGLKDPEKMRKFMAKVRE